jgi:hypothetical protein
VTQGGSDEGAPAEIDVFAFVANAPFEQVATIREGVAIPGQLAVDSQGTLYLPSARGYVAEYANGSTKLMTKLHKGLTAPVGAAIDSRGALFVSDRASIVKFPKGTSAPSLTISSPLFQQLEGETFDKAGNLYVADGKADQVFEIPAGSTVAQSLNLQGLDGFQCTDGPYDGPLGVGFDKDGRLYVSCPNGNIILIFVLPKVQQYSSLSLGDMMAPAFFDFSKSDELFLANENTPSVERFSRDFGRQSYLGPFAAPVGALIRPK